MTIHCYRSLQGWIDRESGIGTLGICASSSSSCPIRWISDICRPIFHGIPDQRWSTTTTTEETSPKRSHWADHRRTPRYRRCEDQNTPKMKRLSHKCYPSSVEAAGWRRVGGCVSSAEANAMGGRAAASWIRIIPRTTAAVDTSRVGGDGSQSNCLRT